MRSIKPIQKVIDHLETLPGIGPKSAQRLAYYMLRMPQERLESFGEAVAAIKRETVMCERCFNVDTHSPCSVCGDQTRDQHSLCVVESPLDLLAMERAGGFRGVYHVLHGVINPLNNVGPEDIYLPQLLGRLRKEEIGELILATNPSLEGEATAMYITAKAREQISDLRFQNMKITRIGRGLPTGADIEYADELTINRAMEGRREV
ncbi:recombination protein RecR [Candidatus Collierbacteria bacterium RIFOXYB1_FULL_49_13]|uniref:Recombination protein RecR n=1 Tax=Candidatus Collierbacteria bacterium RIFOXYB1_FULL_49_13 TaxID=1817728 RepID=A0A1F5FIK7_9BACT|nr:MAG: recombination protein RecR [Candidatus Collierbacteria bacterium RIFOXYB1_FULL_49_13]